MPLFRGTLVLALACALAGCYTPQPAVKLRLDISLGGGYLLDGQPVSAPELDRALADRARRGESALLEIHASPLASFDAVRRVLAAAQDAHAEVAFASAAVAAAASATTVDTTPGAEP